MIAGRLRGRLGASRGVAPTCRCRQARGNASLGARRETNETGPSPDGWRCAWRSPWRTATTRRLVSLILLAGPIAGVRRIDPSHGRASKRRTIAPPTLPSITHGIGRRSCARESPSLFFEQANGCTTRRHEAARPRMNRRAVFAFGV